MLICNSERHKFYSPKSSVINIIKLFMLQPIKKKVLPKISKKRRTYYSLEDKYHQNQHLTYTLFQKYKTVCDLFRFVLVLQRVPSPEIYVKCPSVVPRNQE